MIRDNTDRTWITFLTLVKDRPDFNLKIDEYQCQYCKSSDIKIVGSHYTLVGGRDEDDVNHVWTNIHCNECEKDSVHEHIHNNVWYTDGNGKILAGIPSCFEDYTYTCSECGGDVIRKYIKIDSDEEAVYLYSGWGEDGVWKNFYRTRFECKSCGRSIISDIDYWTNGCENPTPALVREDEVKKLKCEWTVKEEIGICVVNSDVLRKSFSGDSYEKTIKQRET